MTWTKIDKAIDYASSPQGMVWTMLSAALYLLVGAVASPMPAGDFLMLVIVASVFIVLAMVFQTWVAEMRAERIARRLLRGAAYDRP